MRSVNGGLVIVIGFLLLYVAVTGKLGCLSAAWQCLSGGTDGGVTPLSGPPGSGGGVAW